MFGALFAKTHRVHRIFNNKKLARVRMGPGYVLRVLGVVLLAETAVLAILTGTLPPSVFGLTDTVANIQFSLCIGPPGASGDPYVILAALHFGLLAWGSWLAYQTRGVSAGFNESMWIGLSIYNVLICEALGFILNSLKVCSALCSCV